MNPRLKTFMASAAIIGGVLCTLILAVRLLMSFLNPGFIDTADRFFADVQSGRLARAYARTAPETRRDLSFQSFETFLRQTGLVSFDSAKWEEYGVSPDGTAELRGVAVIRTAKEQEISRPIRLVLVNSRGHWTVRSVE